MQTSERIATVSTVSTRRGKPLKRFRPLWPPHTQLTCIFHTRRSRRREEADLAERPNTPPPHVGGYNLSGFQSVCKISGLKQGVNERPPIILENVWNMLAKAVPDQFPMRPQSILIRSFDPRDCGRGGTRRYPVFMAPPKHWIGSFE